MHDMEPIAEFEIHVDGVYEAGASGPRESAYREAMNYATQYAQDGDVEVFEVTRLLVAVVKREAP